MSSNWHPTAQFCGLPPVFATDSETFGQRCTAARTRPERLNPPDTASRHLLTARRSLRIAALCARLAATRRVRSLVRWALHSSPRRTSDVCALRGRRQFSRRNGPVASMSRPGSPLEAPVVVRRASRVYELVRTSDKVLAALYQVLAPSYDAIQTFRRKRSHRSSLRRSKIQAAWSSGDLGVVVRGTRGLLRRTGAGSTLSLLGVPHRSI